MEIIDYVFGDDEGNVGVARFKVRETTRNRWNAISIESFMKKIESSIRDDKDLTSEQRVGLNEQLKGNQELIFVKRLLARFDNEKFNFVLARDGNGNIFGCGRTVRSCKMDARKWLEEEPEWVNPWEYSRYNQIILFASTEAAYRYAKERGGEASCWYFQDEDNTVKLVIEHDG